MSEFFRTRMGHTFFEVTLPRLVEELARLNGLLERAIAIGERAVEQTAKRESSEADT